VLAKDVKGMPSQAVDLTTNFPADQQVIHLLASVAEAPAGTRVKVAWIAVDVGSAAPANTRISEAEARVEGAATIDFTLSRPANGWPAGRYRTDIYLNDRLDRSVAFTVAVAVASGTTLGSAAASPASSGNAQRQTMGNVIFSIPEGWRVTHGTADLTVLAPTNAPKGDNTCIVVCGGYNFDGDIASWFSASWDSMIKGLTVLESGQSEKGQINGVEVCFRSCLLSGLGGDRFRHSFLVFRPGKRVEPIVIRVTEPANQVTENAIGAFLAGIEFRNLPRTVSAMPPDPQAGVAGSSPPPPPAGAQPTLSGDKPKEIGIESVYCCIRVEKPKFMEYGEPSTSLTLYHVFPGGHFAFGWGTKGLDGTNVQEARQRSPDFWSDWTWEAAKSRLVVKANDGYVSVYPMEEGRLLAKRADSIDRFIRLRRCTGMSIVLPKIETRG
jgi:hypothetical protein